MRSSTTSRGGVDLTDPAIAAAIEYGIDISLLQENLKRTPTERLERLVQRIKFSEELKRARSTLKK